MDKQSKLRLCKKNKYLLKNTIVVLTDRAEKNIKIKNRLLREISFNKHKELKISNNKAEVCVIYILVCTIKTVNMEGTCSSVKLVYKFCYLSP